MQNRLRSAREGSQGARSPPRGMIKKTDTSLLVKIGLIYGMFRFSIINPVADKSTARRPGQSRIMQTGRYPENPRAGEKRRMPLWRLP